MGRRRSQGEGSIYRWEAKDLWVAELTVSGKTYKKYSKKQGEVKDWLLTQRNLAKRGKLVSDEHITLGEFVDQWMDDVARPALRPSTIAAHESLIRTHIKPGLGDIRISKLTPLQVQTFCSNKLRSGLSNRTVKYLRTILHQSLDHAKELKLIGDNPVDPVKTPAPEKRPVVPLTKGQVWLLLDYLKDDRLFPLYVVFLGCGLRRGEALALTTDAVDLENGIVYVRQTLQQLTGKGLVVGEPKSEASRRPVAMPDYVRDALSVHLTGKSGYVFTTSKGTPFSPRNIVRHFKKALKKTGLPETTRVHDLRHFFISWLLAQGTPPKDVQEIAGHAQFSTTMDTYGHLMPGANQAAAKRMDTLFKR